MTSRLAHQPALDGLRGLSVAAILVFHAGFSWASGGYLGVSVFFTLSGYLITSLLRAERDATGRIALGRFWERRARRLLPAGLLGIALAAIFGLVAADPSQLRNLRGDGLATLLYVANWWFHLSGQAYENLFAAPSPLLHYWSLAIEEQFYLVYPLIVVFVLRVGRGSWRVLGASLALAASASLAFSLLWMQSGGSPSRIYYGTDARAAELMVGALLALMLPPPTPASGGPRSGGRVLAAVGFASLVGMLVAFVLAPAGSVLGGALPAFSLVSAGVLAGSLVPGPVRGLLSWRPLCALGRISYGVYVYHWPIVLWLDEERTGLDPVPLFFLRLVVVLAVSGLSYRLIEMPVRRAAPRGRRAIPLVVVAMAATGALLIVTTRHAPPQSALATASGSTGESPTPGMKPRGPIVAVVGGSEAWSIWIGLNDFARDGGGFRAHGLFKPWCGIARGGLQDVQTDRRFEARCGEWAARWREQVVLRRPPVVLLIPSVWDLTDRELPGWEGSRGPGDPVFDAWLLAEFEAATDDALAGGGRAVWLTSPCVEARDLVGPLRGNPALSIPRIRYLNDRVLPRAIRDRPRASIIDLDAVVCGDDASLQRGSTEPLRPDGLHFSLPGSRHLAEWLVPQLLAPTSPPREGGTP